ncbi:unnamed protein product [Penicillium salamii]|nr:unnamed protein product [Penicillium salamii]
MIADLGSDRRNKCTTVDAKRARFEADAIESQRRIHVEGSEAHRRLENDEDLLNKWNHFHESIDDTAQMEQLPDIAAGQSHRASLNAAMRALESQAPGNQFHGPVARGGSHTGGHAGRGGGIAGSRGRGASLPRDRTTSLGAISKPGHPGPANRSASVSLGLDPALNINNNPSENDSRRPRGPRRRKSTSMLPSSQQLQRSSGQQQRPDVNFSNMMADPANFMTSYRKAFETSLAFSQGQGHATTASPNVKPGKNTLQPEAAAAPPVIAKSPAQTVLPEKTLPVGKPKAKTGKGAPKSEAIAASAVISNPLAQAVTPKKTLPAGKPEAHNGKGVVKSEVGAVQPVLSKSSVQLRLAEKTLQSLQPIKRNALAATSDSTAVGMMGSYQVETPTPSPKASGARKIIQPKKSKANNSAGRIFQPADVGPPSKGIQWHISPGEFPRTSQPIAPVAQTKKSKVAAGSKPPVAPSKHTKAPSDLLVAPAGASVSKSVASNVSTAAVGGNPPVSRNLTPKKQIQIESLLDTANSPISARILETTPAPSAAPGKDVRVSEAVVAADECEDGKPPVPDIPKQKAKNAKKAEEVKKAQDCSLLDTENQPISEVALELPILTPNPPAKSPGTAELLGLKFSAEGSQKTIDKTLVRANQVSISQNAEFERLLAKRVNEEVEIRLKHAREVLKRPSNKIARFEDWLNQADQEEATVIQDVLRKASFTGYRSRKEVLTDSSGETSPVPKTKVSGQFKNVSNDFMNRFSIVGAASGSASCDTPTRAPPALTEAALPIKVAPVPVKAAPISAKPAKPAQVVSSAVTAKAAPISVEGTSANRPAPKKKQQSLLDSIYATEPEETMPAPRLLSGNIPNPQDPRATGVRLIGPAPYDPKKKHENTSAVSAQQSAENTKFSGVQLVGPAPYDPKAYGQSHALNTQQASGNSKFVGSDDSEPVNRVKVIGVQPYNPINRRK